MKTKELKLPVFSLKSGKKESESIVTFESEVGVDNTHVFYLTKKYQQAARRAGTASTKTISEVSGGGSKPFKQKGTGRARRGSNRTVLRPGGGVVFGPKPRSFSHKLNSKLVRGAILGGFIENAENVIILQHDENTSLKTKEVFAFVSSIAAPQKTLLIIKNTDSPLFRAARNIDGIKIASVSNIPVEKLIASESVIIDQSAYEFLKASVTHA
jgi:large subunit ribosomal protein L4